MECEILSDGSRKIIDSLFQHIITENRMEDGEFRIRGYHEIES